MAAMPAPFDNPDEAHPIPPRFWWLKRISIGLGAYVLFLALVRIGWGYYAESRLQSALATWRAAGQPVTIDDLAPRPVPDKENGAWYIQQAILKKAVPAGMPNDVYWQALNVDAYRDGPVEIEQIVAANTEPLALLRVARACTESDWGYTLRSPLVNSMRWDWSPERQLARLVRLAALRAQVTGNDSEWLEGARDLLAFGRHLGQSEPFLIGHITRLGIDGLVAGRVQAFSHALRVGADDERDAAGRAAKRAQVAALIADLCDEHPVASAWARSMFGERLLQLDAFQNPGVRPVYWGFSRRQVAASRLALEPGWKLGALRVATLQSDLADAPPEWLLTSARAEDDPARASGLIPFLVRGPYALSGFPLPSAARVQLAHLAFRRMAAAALAIRLYELDHGRRPAQLADLVPDYLPAVPVDPLAADGREIAYHPDAEPPVLYSVGENGTDDGGKPAETPEHLGRDQLFYLNGDPPHQPTITLPSSTAPSTQAVDDDRQPEEGGDHAGDEAGENEPEHIQDRHPQQGRQPAAVQQVLHHSQQSPLAQQRGVERNYRRRAVPRHEAHVAGGPGVQPDRQERQAQRQHAQRRPGVVAQRDRPILLLEPQPA